VFVNVLLFSAGKKLCGLPLREVQEVMRPRELERNASLPAFVLGTCLVRQQPTPVIDVAALMGERSCQTTRLITLALGQGPVALAVDSVLGTTRVDEQQFREATPLVCGDRDVVSALTILDSKLVYLINSARLLPDDMPELKMLFTRAGMDEVAATSARSS